MTKPTEDGANFLVQLTILLLIRNKALSKLLANARDPPNKNANGITDELWQTTLATHAMLSQLLQFRVEICHFWLLICYFLCLFIPIYSAWSYYDRGFWQRNCLKNFFFVILWIKFSKKDLFIILLKFKSKRLCLRNLSHEMGNVCKSIVTEMMRSTIVVLIRAFSVNFIFFCENLYLTRGRQSWQRLLFSTSKLNFERHRNDSDTRFLSKIARNVFWQTQLFKPRIK